MNESIPALTPELYGEGISLRELTLDDAERYFNLVDFDRGHLSQFGDETAAKYPDVKEVEDSILNQAKPVHRFGIWDKDTMVGLIKLTELSPGMHEVGYWVGKEHIGHGFAAKALEPITEYAIRNLGAHTVIGKVAQGNYASRKSLERAGFVFCGEKDGQWLLERSAA